MIKLVRNTLSKKDLSYENQSISWKYIEKLVLLQEAEKLYLTTKVTRRHVYFENEKMKVHLAVQVLSNSVRDALAFLEYDLKLSNFAGASGTMTFCKMFNDIFDLLNSRNLYNKTETKRGITKDNIHILKDKINEFILYIKSIRLKHSSILESVNKTGFIGLIIDLQNIIALAEQLFNENIEFLLTYKLSQDHLETFFSLIRRRNGWNNNSTAKLFKASYRQILYLSNVSVPLSANCIPQDDTVLVGVSDNSSVQNEQEIESAQEIDIDSEQFIINDILMDHDYFGENWCFTDYADEVITYISGFIARTVKKRIDCSFCKQLLVLSDAQKETDTHRPDKLLQRKNRGGLCLPSPDVIIICKNAEKSLRLYNKDRLFQTKNILNILINQALCSLPSDIFNMNDHLYDQLPSSDHRSQLMKLILKTFFNMRMKHESKTFTNFKRIRMRNNKLTLFQNQ